MRTKRLRVRWLEARQRIGFYPTYAVISDQNLALQDELYKLRSKTKDTFDEAKILEARWAELQREQKEVYQVRQPSRSTFEAIY